MHTAQNTANVATRYDLPMDIPSDDCPSDCCQLPPVLRPEDPKPPNFRAIIQAASAVGKPIYKRMTLSPRSRAANHFFQAAAANQECVMLVLRWDQRAVDRHPAF